MSKTNLGKLKRQSSWAAKLALGLLTLGLVGITQSNAIKSVCPAKVSRRKASANFQPPRSVYTQPSPIIYLKPPISKLERIIWLFFSLHRFFARYRQREIEREREREEKKLKIQLRMRNRRESLPPRARFSTLFLDSFATREKLIHIVNREWRWGKSWSCTVGNKEMQSEQRKKERKKESWRGGGQKILCSQGKETAYAYVYIWRKMKKKKKKVASSLIQRRCGGSARLIRRWCQAQAPLGRRRTSIPRGQELTKWPLAQLLALSLCRSCASVCGEPSSTLEAYSPLFTLVALSRAPIDSICPAYVSRLGDRSENTSFHEGWVVGYNQRDFPTDRTLVRCMPCNQSTEFLPRDFEGHMNL